MKSNRVRKSSIYIILVILFALIIGSCTSAETPSPTDPIPTPTSSPTQEPTATPTTKPTPTLTSSSTATSSSEPIYVTLGAPFADDCGDGIPRIWSNDAYNSMWKPGCNDDHHGHVDLFVPIGCDVNTYEGEVISPVDGFIQKYIFDGGWGYHLFLTKDTLIYGIEEALIFVGFKEPDLKQISQIFFRFRSCEFS